MAALYVVEQGVKIHKESRRLVVKKDEQELLFGNVGVTTPALTWLMAQNIDVVFCDQHGRYRGRVVGQTSGHSQLRRLQYRRVENTLFATNTARAIVRAKLQNSRTLLLRYERKLDKPGLAAAAE
ncbi:MAG: CRISPR-associated endonuclease Cas1, partial [Anaerolineae bacterium]|nr:CRISPR-associated endonuclease Cas1 [Anaerolineae bacterium]